MQEVLWSVAAPPGQKVEWLDWHNHSRENEGQHSPSLKREKEVKNETLHGPRSHNRVDVEFEAGVRAQLSHR